MQMRVKTLMAVLIWGLGPVDSQYRVQVRRPVTMVGGTSGGGEIIDLASATGKYDAGFVCQPRDADKWKVGVDAHWVQIDPILSKSERFGSIVHHMDIFACASDVHAETAALRTRAQQPAWGAHDAFLQSRCKQLIWAYDPGAESFKGPEEAAVLAGTDHILTQTHYALPCRSTTPQTLSWCSTRSCGHMIRGYSGLWITPLTCRRTANILCSEITSSQNAREYDCSRFSPVWGSNSACTPSAWACDRVALEHYRGEQKPRTYEGQF